MHDGSGAVVVVAVLDELRFVRKGARARCGGCRGSRLQRAFRATRDSERHADREEGSGTDHVNAFQTIAPVGN